jgi:hypothetical protein
MSARANRWVIAAAIVALILGAMLSRVIEPDVRVEKIMLTTNSQVHLGDQLMPLFY